MNKLLLLLLLLFVNKINCSASCHAYCSNLDRQEKEKQEMLDDLKEYNLIICKKAQTSQLEDYQRKVTNVRHVAIGMLVYFVVTLYNVL